MPGCSEISMMLHRLYSCAQAKKKAAVNYLSERRWDTRQTSIVSWAELNLQNMKMEERGQNLCRLTGMKKFPIL